MYAWIWRNMPGPVWVRIALSAVSIAAIVVLLFLVVFPWAENHVPFLRVTVDEQTTTGVIAQVWLPDSKS